MLVKLKVVVPDHFGPRSGSCRPKLTGLSQIGRNSSEAGRTGLPEQVSSNFCVQTSNGSPLRLHPAKAVSIRQHGALSGPLAQRIFTCDTLYFPTSRSSWIAPSCSRNLWIVTCCWLMHATTSDRAWSFPPALRDATHQPLPTVVLDGIQRMHGLLVRALRRRSWKL